MSNPGGHPGPSPLSSYFQDAQPGEPSLAPLTPIDNTLANIGNLDKDKNLTENTAEAASKLFADVSNFSVVQDNSYPEQQVQYVTSAQLKPLAQVLPDPSTFFDTIGSKAVQPSDAFNPPIPDSFSTPLEIPLDKITPPDSQSTGSEGDRRRDSWIPTDDAKKILVQAQNSSAGSFFPEREVLTMPGVVLESDLGDELYDVVAHYLGEEEAVQRGSLGCEHVTQDDRGLRELIQAGCFRAAINLTTRLLTNYGQGVRRAGHPSKHSPRSLQLWFTRLALLTKINSYSLCELEAEAFGMLQNPDMYFQFYPDTYPNRTGSMASFSFRLLLAELPMYNNKPDVAIARLHIMLAVIRKMIKNLRSSKCEDGSDKQISAQDRQESLKLWSGREARLQFSIVNCALQMKDYILATQIIESMAASPVWGAAHTRALQSALGRICLQAGHISGAETYFKKATQIRATLSSSQDVRELVDQSLLSVAQNSFSDAYQCLVKANQLEPANIMVLNNMAVCLLYSGKLKEAISVMENAVNSNPSRGLSESLLLNLCTLYELESSNTMTKKLALLQQLCRYKSDTVTNVTTCLKLHM